MVVVAGGFGVRTMIRVCAALMGDDSCSCDRGRDDDKGDYG